MTVDLNDVPVAQPAQRQAPAHLLTRFEVQSDVTTVTPEDIDEAPVDVAKDMGW